MPLSWNTSDLSFSLPDRICFALTVNKDEDEDEDENDPFHVFGLFMAERRRHRIVSRMLCARGSRRCQWSITMAL